METNNENFVEDSHYKVQCGKAYYIRKYVVELPNGVNIVNYYIPVLKKTNGKKENFNKMVRFKTGVELKDNTKILINNMFEDVKLNKNDKYNPIWHLMITDFDIIEEPDDVNTAIRDYQSNLENERIDSDIPLF